ncbi:hypothetical protein PC129_g20902 [Phytophthora cactorum]|nr:hypothetical protein Pcac1_g26574 [Phytophthora cactorum]KAG2832522.1 hypothetical protein PC112_g6878 [Phytophthora cactorum]KAG2834561.1 hypothetical protein PC111_g5794 [Phytophthora cactorum]KAG2861657.1 hypothetical protein PC113_g6970 [Phytophthora cactorum]KAG2917977.1 hypothetical protein PC114_g6961 [Phytophthora cactorum]
MPATIDRDERVIDFTNVGEFVDRLRPSLHDIHQEVTDMKERQQLRDMAAHKGSPVNFEVGDLVLWSRIDQRLPNHKLIDQWVGLFKVVAALPHTFEIEHLVTVRKYEGHPSRLKFYADAELSTTTEILELVSSQRMVLGVDRFVNHRFNQQINRWELLVSWLGLQAIGNSWEPLTTLLQDVPAKIHEYADASGVDELRAQLLAKLPQRSRPSFERHCRPDCGWLSSLDGITASVLAARKLLTNEQGDGTRARAVGPMSDGGDCGTTLYWAWCTQHKLPVDTRTRPRLHVTTDLDESTGRTQREEISSGPQLTLL